jgi:hypothetical protein
MFISGSRIRLFSIPDPGSESFPSRILIKEFKYFNPKKWFQSSRKYDLGCSFRIRILTGLYEGIRMAGRASRWQGGHPDGREGIQMAGRESRWQGGNTDGREGIQMAGKGIQMAK